MSSGRRLMGHDWEWMERRPGLPKSQRLNGCLNESGKPKICWPNHATARWYLTNLPMSWTLTAEPYDCPTCGNVHTGRPPQGHKRVRYVTAKKRRRRERNRAATAAYVSWLSMCDYPVDE